MIKLLPHSDVQAMKRHDSKSFVTTAHSPRFSVAKKNMPFVNNCQRKLVNDNDRRLIAYESR